MSAMNPMKLSIIIPAYNASNYIENTILSVVKQSTDTSYEVIIINDGSTDDTADIVNDLSSLYPQIVLHTIANNGPANARNYAISIARGEYILFLDADDTFTTNALPSITDLVCTDKDLYIWGYNLVNEKVHVTTPYHCVNLDLNNPSGIKEQFHRLYKINQLNQVWNKLFKRSILIENQIAFPHYTYGEDRLFVISYLKCINSLVCVKDCYYNYYIRNNDSLVTRYCPDKLDVCCKINSQVTEYVNYDTSSHSVQKDYDYMFFKSIVSCLTNFCTSTSPLSYTQQRLAIKTLLCNVDVQLLLKKRNNYNVFCTLISCTLKFGNITLIHWIGKGIILVSTYAPSLYIKSKHKENNK